MFCYACGNQLREGAAFCDKCGKPQGAQVSPPAQPVAASYGTSGFAHAAAPYAPPAAYQPPAAVEKLADPTGGLTPFGLSVSDRVFNHFDADRSGTLQLEELNAMMTFSGSQPMNVDSWAFIIDLLGIELTPNHHLGRSEFPKLFRFLLHTDPNGCRSAFARLGINLDAAAFPPQPTPQELQQFQQMCFDRAQRQRAAQMRDAAQTSQFMHGLGMQIRNAMAERVCYNCGRKVAPGKCSNCGAV